MSLRILHWAAVCPACIQSFLIDNDKPYDTQREMIARAQAEGLCGSKDAPTDYVLDHNVDKFCALHEIECRKLEDRKIPSEIPKGEGILLGCWNYGNAAQSHCVRFSEYISAEKFQVMNPALLSDADTFPEMTIGRIEQWGCDVWKIHLKDSPKPEK